MPACSSKTLWHRHALTILQQQGTTFSSMSHLSFRTLVDEKILRQMPTSLSIDGTIFKLLSRTFQLVWVSLSLYAHIVMLTSLYISRFCWDIPAGQIDIGAEYFPLCLYSNDKHNLDNVRKGLLKKTPMFRVCAQHPTTVVSGWKVPAHTDWASACEEQVVLVCGAVSTTCWL